MVGRPFGRQLMATGLVSSAIALWSLPAAAYCRSMSCELGEDPAHPSCERDEQGCVTEGKPLHWPSPCLEYAVQLDGSPKSGLEADAVLELVEQAFLLWQTAECPGGGHPRFTAQFQGFVSCHHRESVCGGVDGNVNVFMFYDSDWPGQSNQLGLTSPAGGVESGRLLDADVEFNAEDFVFAEDASDLNANPLFYVIAHEIGHYLGLAHSDVDGALMFDGYQSLSGSLLSADDVAAVCAAYPPGPALSCGASGGPAYDACRLPERGTEPDCSIASGSQSSGCSVSTVRQSGLSGALPFGIGALAFALSRRRARAAR